MVIARGECRGYGGQKNAIAQMGQYRHTYQLIPTLIQRPTDPQRLHKRGVVKDPVRHELWEMKAVWTRHAARNRLAVRGAECTAPTMTVRAQPVPSAVSWQLTAQDGTRSNTCSSDPAQVAWCCSQAASRPVTRRTQQLVRPQNKRRNSYVEKKK